MVTHMSRVPPVYGITRGEETCGVGGRVSIWVSGGVYGGGREGGGVRV